MSRVLFRYFLSFICLFLYIASTSSVAADRPSYTLNQRAIEQMDKGDYLVAIDLLKQALVIQPKHEVVRYNLGQAYLSLGEQLIKENKYSEAIEMLENGKQYDDQESRLWLFRGLALLKENDYQYAESELNEAWAMSGDQPQVLWLLGRLYYHTDQMREAVDVWERALQLEPGNQIIIDQLNRARQELDVEKEMEKGYGSNFIITYDGEVSTALSNELLGVLEDAYSWVGNQLGHYPQRRVPVIIYANKDFKSLTSSPDWASGLYDGKIRLPAGGISKIDSSVAGLLYHEYMHAVVHELAGNRVPFWLNEGLAEVAASEQRSPSLDLLVQARREGTLFKWSELEAPARTFEVSRVGIAYLQSYDFVRSLVSEFGWFQIRDLLEALGKGASISAAIDQSIGIYAVDYQSLQKRWAEEGLQ